MTRLDELEFIVDRSIKQAVATQAPVALILSPLLTGGKVFKLRRRPWPTDERCTGARRQRQGDEPRRPDAPAGRQAEAATRP